MKTQLNKLMIIALTGMMLTTAPKKAEALIPLPSFDFSRISENVKKTINQVMEIKAEIDSNLMILREIQNGGFAAAAGMLFAKIENGDYDRLGGNITGLKESMEVNAAEAQGAVAARKECKKKADEVKKKMEDLYKKCEGEEMSEEDAKKCMNDVKKQIKKAVDKERKMCELEMNKATGEKIAEIRRKNVEKAEKKAEEYNKQKKGEVTFHNVYSWVQGANVSGAISTATNGGSAGDIIKGFGSSAGAILGGAGDENAKLISGASSVIGGVSNTVGEGGSFQDTIVNGLNNGDIMGGFDQIQDGHDDYMAEQQRQQEEAARAAEEAARQAEETRRQQEEAARQMEEWQNTLRNGGAVDHSYRGQ